METKKGIEDMTFDEIKALAEKELNRQKAEQSDLVIVEIPLPDGWMSMFGGRLVRRDDNVVVLVDAAFIKDTGRRHRFFTADFDESVEVEPYPDGVEIELPAPGAVVTQWPHAPLRSVM